MFTDSAKIYVQVPAYRDQELGPTLLDLYAKATSPERLRVGVVWQRDDTDRLSDAVYRLPQLELIEVPYTRSLGCNWARSLLQQRWSGEPYTLLLDSHHRFAQGWDERVIGMYEQLRNEGVPKPLVTAYLPAYDPAREPRARRKRPYKIYPYGREAGLLTKLTSYPIPFWKRLSYPVEADFISLHFLFAAGKFNEEVPLDPQVYFFGDEVVTGVRAYTSGYDLYHPQSVLGWHSYNRSTRVPHWHDHTRWLHQHQQSLARIRKIFTGHVRGSYGLGDQRSVRQYEERIMTSLVTE